MSMNMNISELISVLSQVSRELETAAVQHGSLADISREAAQLQEQLCRGKQVTPAQLRALNTRLWGVRMRPVAQYGHSSNLIHFLDVQSHELENAVKILNTRWRYREWASSAASFILPAVFIIPLLIMQCYMMKADCTGNAELYTVLAGTCFTGLSLFALWAKDPVGLFWSLYSFIPLYLLRL